MRGGDGGVEIWWLGQAGFRLRSTGAGTTTTLFVDPFFLDRPDRTWPAPAGAGDLAMSDVVLSTHEHRDHFDRPTLQAAAEAVGSRFTLVVPTPLVPDAVALGLPPHRVVGAQPQDALTLAGGAVHVWPVPARHGVNVADAYTFGEELSGGLVRYLGYVVDIGGVRLYHAGDTIPYPAQVEQVRALRPEIALLPINGRDYFREAEHNLVGNLNPREAARLAVDVGAHTLIPMHWELFARNLGHPAELAAYVADTFPQLSVLVMGRGARVTLGPAAPAPTAAETNQARQVY